MVTPVGGFLSFKSCFCWLRAASCFTVSNPCSGQCSISSGASDPMFVAEIIWIIRSLSLDWTLLLYSSGWWYTYSSSKIWNGKDDIPYMKWNKNVWNHQPVLLHRSTHYLVFIKSRFCWQYLLCLLLEAMVLLRTSGSSCSPVIHDQKTMNLAW